MPAPRRYRNISDLPAVIPVFPLTGVLLLPRTRQPYLSDRSMQTDWKSIQEAPAETLVNALCMLCPFEPSEKQALLEAPGLGERADALIALIEMANASAIPSGGSPSIN